MSQAPQQRGNESTSDTTANKGGDAQAGATVPAPGVVKGRTTSSGAPTAPRGGAAAPQRVMNSGRPSVSPTASPRPENVPAVIQHLREMFTDISDTLVTDAYRSGLVNGTIEDMYVSFYSRSNRIVEQVVQKHGMNVYVAVMQENLMRLLTNEFREHTAEQVYWMCQCCSRYQDPGMLFNSLLSTDCLERLIECTKELVEQERPPPRHMGQRGRHGSGGGAGVGFDHGHPGWHGMGGVRGGADGISNGGPANVSRQRGEGMPVSVDMYRHSGLSPMPGAMAGNGGAGFGNAVESEVAPRFSGSPRSPNSGTGALGGSTYHSIPAPRGMTAGYTVRSEESAAAPAPAPAIKQPLPRSAAMLMQQQQMSQRQPSSSSVGGVAPAEPFGVLPQKPDALAPAAFHRDAADGANHRSPAPQVSSPAPSFDARQSPSPPTVVERSPSTRIVVHHHHHHFVQQPVPAPMQGQARPDSTQAREPRQGPMHANASPPAEVPGARAATTPNPSSMRPVMAGPFLHHHHHHLHMHRDPFGNASPQAQPSAGLAPPAHQHIPPGPGAVASGFTARSTPSSEAVATPAPVAHVVSPLPPQTSSMTSVRAPRGAAGSTVQPTGASVVIGSLPRPHHHHHHHHSALHAHGSPISTGSPATPFQAAPLGATSPAEPAFSANRVSSPPSATMARDVSAASSAPLRVAVGPLAAAGVIPRHHHHHHSHHLQSARPPTLGAPVDVARGGMSMAGGSGVQRPPSSIDAGAEDDGNEVSVSWRGSPAGMVAQPVRDPSAVAEEMRAHLVNGGVEPRTATTVASLGCSLAELRRLPWPQTEHMFRLSGVPTSSFPVLRDLLLGKEEPPSQLQQFLQRNNLVGHNVSTTSASDSVATPLESASNPSLNTSGRTPLQVPPPRTRQPGTNSATGSPLAPPQNTEQSAAASYDNNGSGTASGGWGADGAREGTAGDGARGRRGRQGGGRGGARRGRGGRDDVQVCKFYNRPGGCQFGSDCRYRHVDA